MIYMDQRREENEDQLQGRGGEGCKCTKNSGVSGQDTEVSMQGGEVREAMSHSSWEGTGSTVAFVGF